MKNWRSASEDDLLQQLSNDIREANVIVHPSDEPFYARIKSRYPTHRFGIRWDKLPIRRSFDAQSGMSPDEHAVFAQRALKQFADDANILPHENVYVLGDGMFTVALEMWFSSLINHARSIFELPQHTYVVKNDYGWCFRCSFEGHIDYGKAIR